MTAQILAFVRTFPGAGDVEIDTPLVTSARLDSLALMGVYGWLERTFQITLPACDLYVDATDTVEGLAKLVERHRSQ